MTQCWVILALLFFGGILITLVSSSFAVGGQIVVVARSLLDFLLWVLLCNTSSRRNINPFTLFLLGGMLPEIISWVLSYILMPLFLSPTSSTAMLSGETLVLLVTFGLIGMVTVAFGILQMRKPEDARPFDGPAVDYAVQTAPLDNLPATGDSATESAPTTQSQGNDFRIPDGLIEACKLTSREVTVASLFAQGYSLAKVADELFISKGTAQTHIKNIYRKVDVHTKDELIETIRSWNERA